MGVREHLLFHRKGRWAEASPLPGWNRETVEEIQAWLITLDHSEKLFSHPIPFPSLELPLWFLQDERELRPILSSELFLGGTPRPQHAPCIKLKNPAFSTLFPQSCRFRIDCQGSLFDLTSLEDRIDYVEDSPVMLPLPMASDKIGSHPIVVHKPSVRGITLPLNKRLILSSSFESDLGLSQIAAFAHAHHLEKEIHGIGTFHLMDQPLLENPPIWEYGVFTPPKRIKPLAHRLTYLWTIPSFSK